MTHRLRAVHGHRAFQALAHASRRARLGAIRVSFVPSDGEDDGIHVAYSISRKVGGAVVRNRWRRRLRAIVGEASDELSPGSYLVGLSPEIADTTFARLRTDVIETMHRASGRVR